MALLQFYQRSMSTLLGLVYQSSQYAWEGGNCYYPRSREGRVHRELSGFTLQKPEIKLE